MGLGSTVRIGRHWAFPSAPKSFAKPSSSALNIVILLAGDTKNVDNGSVLLF